MSSNNEKGLESVEVLEDVDDVPTAAVEAILEVVIDTGPNEENVMDIRTVKDSKEQIKQNCHYDEMQVMNELVTREDYREALEQAVQQARERERRRILERIEFLGYFEFEDKSKEFNKGYRKALQELEEEVDSKTGDSDNFGETDK